MTNPVNGLRWSLFLAALLSWCTGVASAQVPLAQPAAGKPNVVLVLIDDMGFGDLGCYGARKQLTPHIDQLASEGARFTDFYMSAPVCTPSRAALLTGCYHKRVSMNHVLWPVSANGLNPGETTIAEVLRDAGYATHYFGKWHLGDQKAFLPTRQGFDHYHGVPYSHDMASIVRLKKAKGDPSPLHVRVLPVLRDEKVEELVKDVGPLLYDYERESIRFMQESVAEKRPFFVMLAQHAVHLPNEPSDIYRGTSNNGTYGDWIQEIDACIGRIMAEIKRLGVDENTMVILTSDNGPSKRNNGTSGPLKGYKHSTWEGGLRVPLIVRWPTKIPGGQVRGELTTAMDLYPTIARFAGRQLPMLQVIDGVDISPLLLNQPVSTPLRTDFAYFDGPQLMAVRQGDWKLHLQTPDGKARVLYNLKDDMGETQNVAGANPDVVETLLQLAQSFREDLGDRPGNGRGVRKIGRAVTLQPLFKAISHPASESDDAPPEGF